MMPKFWEVVTARRPSKNGLNATLYPLNCVLYRMPARTPTRYEAFRGRPRARQTAVASEQEMPAGQDTSRVSRAFARLGPCLRSRTPGASWIPRRSEDAKDPRLTGESWESGERAAQCVSRRQMNQEYFAQFSVRLAGTAGASP